MKSSKALFLMSLAMVAGNVPAQAKPISPLVVRASTTITLTGSVGSINNSPVALLKWTAIPSASYYVVTRDGVPNAYAKTTAYTDSQIHSGATHFYVVAPVVNGVKRSASKTVTVIFPLPAPTPPSAPSSIAAKGVWVANCPACKMAMAHVIVSWNAPSGTGLTYKVYRNGAVIAQNISATSYTDMSVSSGASYSYAVSAVNAAGEGMRSASASATAPYPPAASAAPIAPANVSVIGYWMGGPGDTVSWSPVPGATSYNVYQYDVPIATGVTSTSYVVPVSDYMWGETYTITAVNAAGAESIPSAPATAQGAFNPAAPSGWRAPMPAVPNHVTATPEWNAGAPRIKVAWYGDLQATMYNVYRDGKLVAPGLFDLAYYDANVKSGESHTYTVTGADVNWTLVQETAQSAPATATAPSGPPAPYAGKVQITSIDANDDSAVVHFAAIPGAQDYRCHTTANPGSVKYSGGGLSIEMNGLDPAAGADLVIEAVDKLGPFQKMDGAMGPGAMDMGTMDAGVNGQGDPSDAPIVLATSDPFHVTLKPRTLTGEQAFFDNFRGEKPLTQDQTIDPVIVAANFNGPNSPSNPFIQSFSNDKWTILDYYGDMINTKLFFDHNHFMDTVYDGGTPGTSTPMHNNNASIVMMPKAVADLSGGKVLHVTFEVDAHLSPRRWIDAVVAAAGDSFIHPGKVETTGLWPTASGNEFRWEIQNEFHHAEEFLGGTENQLIDLSWNHGNERFGPAARIRWDHVPLANGTNQDLDKRHRFDLYLSQTRYRLVESGAIVKDAAFPTPLPFSKMQVYWVHELYHTGNDRPENVQWRPDEKYWYNFRPWADERHWDNMGFEVLTAFP